MLRNCIRLLIAAAFLTAAASQMVRAETSYTYDLDSLVHLSTQVAEVEVVRRYEADGLDLMDARVSRVHKGDFKRDQTVVVFGADRYRKPAKAAVDPQHLEAGDRLVLFLVQVKPSEMLRIPVDATIFTPLAGGMRLIQGDHVFDFSQGDIRGSHVANLPIDPAKARLLTLERFQEQLKDSLRDTQEWSRLLAAPYDELEVPRLLKLLASRPAPIGFDRDYFAERICIRFAEGNDPGPLSRALPLAKDHHALSILQHGFGTPKGRDYLLAKVQDATEPLAARLRYAHALGDAGGTYRESFTEIEANSSKILGEVDEGNSAYLTRVAKAALATRKHEELCLRLIRNLDYFGQGIVQRKLPPLMGDLRGANGVLKELYDLQPAPELQFAIEKTAAWIPADYERLESPCGTFLSILRAADPGKYTKPEKPSLIFEYEYSTLFLPRESEVRPVVVLVHQGTQKEHVIPTQLQVRGWSGGGGSYAVELPKDLPAGKYNVSFQVLDGDKVISAGHSFTAEL